MFTATTFKARAVRLGVSVLALFACGAQNWHTQLDDVYISLGYSWQLVETGTLTWTTGAVVEGYSNVLWVLLGAIPFALGMDPGFFLQSVSVAASVGLLAWLGACLPTDRWLTAALVLVAASDPLGFWAFNGMETVGYALLLAAGWGRLATGRWVSPVGLYLLGLSAFLRPEGILHLGAAVVLGRLLSDRTPWRTLAVLALAFIGYHSLRVWWFGELLPTSVMVKGLDGHPATEGVVQAAIDLVPWVGVGALVASRCTARLRDAAVALVPLGVQLAVIIQAGGDWMGHGRLLLPGAVASLAVFGITCSLRNRRKPFTPVALCVAVVSTLVVSPLGAPRSPELRLPFYKGLWAGLPRPDLDTTLWSDLQYVVPRIPDGSTIYSSDVGMLGHVAGVAIRDTVGLVDIDIARSRAYNDHQALQRTLTRLSGGPESALCIRLVTWRDEDAPRLPEDQRAAYPFSETLRDAWSTIEYNCREDVQVAPSLAPARWQSLATRFPAQGKLTLAYARALASAGEFSQAKTVLEAAHWSVRWGLLSRYDGHALDFVSGSNGLDWVEQRGFALWRNGSIMSRPLDASEMAESALRLDVDQLDDGPVDVTVAVEGPCDASTRPLELAGEHVLPLAPFMCKAPGTSTVTVSLENDRANERGDRNLFVLLLPVSQGRAVE